MKIILLLASAVSALTILNATVANCLASKVVSPRYTPYDVDVTFNETTHLLKYLIYGNMTGQINDTNNDNTLASAITNSVTVAGYTQTKLEKRLCDVARDPIGFSNASYCPFGPGQTLIVYETQLSSSYMFASITSTIRINGPTATDYEIGCFEVTITPPLSSLLNNVLTYIPLMILIVVGIKVVSVVILNPWSGTLDPFRGFSHFGLDINALRMSTPGFSDCLFYLQFIAYSSMLSLHYPGYFQPVTSRIGWSMLAFSSSPITSDLEYTPQLSRTLTTWVNFVGELRQDAWKSFMIWWLIVQACVVALVAIILLAWWLLTPSSTELTGKNLPFLGGAVLRIYLWFLVPMTIFTSFQLLIAQQAQAAAVALSAIVFMFLIILLPTFLVIFIPRHKPRQNLYDDLSILNLVGPLYNTLSEHALMFLVLGLVLAILRGFVIGFLQAYGTAQLTLLLFLEIGNFIGLALMRPWPARTNTTLLNLVLSALRFVVLMLMIPFIGRITVSTGRRELIGYLILIIHAVVLVFMFLGNALLTLLELLIRLLVIVPQDEGARVIFGARQLRTRRRKHTQHDNTQSMTSTNSVTGLLGKEESPFFRTPRPHSRQSRGGMSVDLRSQSSMSDVLRTPTEYHGADYTKSSKGPIVRTHSFASQEILHTISRSALDDPSYDMSELSLAPTEDAARRGVDYAVREADVYHPQASGELLGPSKKLGTGPANPNGVVFRKIKWAPWRKEQNSEKGKFVVVRSHPAPQRSLSTSSVPLQELSPDSEPRSNPLSPQYESIAEEEEVDEPYFNRPPSQDVLQEHGIRLIVNDTAPRLPQLHLPSPEAVDTSEPLSPSSHLDYIPLDNDDHELAQTSSVRSTPVRSSIRDTLLSPIPQTVYYDS